MFIGRKKELQSLEKLYGSRRFEMAVIYGRRRVGKTSLIREFIRDKKAIYFMGIESNEKQNLQNFSDAIHGFHRGEGPAPLYASFQDALEAVFQMAKEERIILVIDEYPYAARTSPGLSSILQRLIDQYRDNSRLMIILCGSSMSYMEDEVLAYKSPLYGRRTAQLKILPFSFRECCLFLHGFSPEDQAVIYGMTGGTAPYLLEMDSRLTLEENVKESFLNPASLLYEEPENLLKQEVREPSMYNAMISAVAGGATRLSEIASQTGETTSTCSTYMKSLMELGIIKRETPYGEKSGRKSIYRIDDNMFRFWYRFIPANTSLIERGADELAWKRIAPSIPEYMGAIFEQICQEYLWGKMLEGESPILFQSLGRWWGNDPVRKKQTEIDIMGIEDKTHALFGECKWTNEKIDLPILHTLMERSGLFSFAEKELYLFSRQGFTKSVLEAAEGNTRIHLLTYEGMWKDYFSRP